MIDPHNLADTLTGATIEFADGATEFADTLLFKLCEMPAPVVALTRARHAPVALGDSRTPHHQLEGGAL